MNNYGINRWYNQLGQLHREDGPAYEDLEGTKFWLINGQLHREDGPAREWADGTKAWYVRDRLHREDGPAVEYANGSKEYWIEGKRLTEKDFNKKYQNIKTYTNRYGDKFTFEYNERGNIQWSGNFEYCRTAFNDNPDNITMVDPSGGPYINIGRNMKSFGLEGIVAGFIPNESGYEIVLTSSREDWNDVKYRMDTEGFHYCYKGYSYFEHIKDEKFHELRLAYLKAADELENYVNSKIEQYDK